MRPSTTVAETRAPVREPVSPRGPRKEFPGTRVDEAEQQPEAGLDPAFLLSTPHWKRVLDLVLIAFLLPVILPLLMVVGVWIRAVSDGPVLFHQVRVGRGGRRFMMYKFRSMRVGSEVTPLANHIRAMVRSGRPMQKLDAKGDDRLITGGCLLRATGLDELPQLLNVIRGEMSLVGPRPCLPLEMEFLKAHPKRFKVLPGITGQWQVNGKNSLTFEEMVAQDDDYAERSSLWTDFKVLCRTPWAVFKQMGACVKKRINNSTSMPEGEIE